MAQSKPQKCKWLSLRDAGDQFVRAQSGTQGSEHIRPLHWYVACRLVVEGGFRPDEITPRPPFRVETTRHGDFLHYDAALGGTGERTVFGGLKTKNIDVVAVNPALGPCLAVSIKGTLNAYRNLTNRLEEAVGDCTNLHVAYPALVYGFLHLIRANRAGNIPEASRRSLQVDAVSGGIRTADVAIRTDGTLAPFVASYCGALARLSARRDLRDDPSRYESVSVVLMSVDDDTLGEPHLQYPKELDLAYASFFASIYRQFDLRYVFGAPNLSRQTSRRTWNEQSPALASPILHELDYSPRIGVHMDEFQD